MFIAHGAWVRKNMRWLMAIILVILIPGFVFMFTRTDTASRRMGQLPTIRGKPVNPAELQAAEAAVRDSYLLQTGKGLPGTEQMQDALTEQGVVRLLELREARRFGIQVSDAELIRYIQWMFRNKNGQFDPTNYQRMMRQLSEKNISEAEFEEMMRQQLTVQRLEGLVDTGVVVTPEEVTLAYTPLHEEAVGEYVVFNSATVTNTITVSDADAKEYFEKHQAEFRLPPMVNIRYARFAIDTNQVPAVTEKDISNFYERNQDAYTNGLAAAKTVIRNLLVRARAQRAAGDRATDFSGKLTPEVEGSRPSFAKLAAQFGVPVQETGFFARSDSVPHIPADMSFNQTAFGLSAIAPVSDPIEAPDAYYVLEWLATKPSTAPPFAQAKGQVVARLQSERALAATARQGQEAVTKIKDLMAKGKTFAQACAELELTVTPAPPFSFGTEVPALPAADAVKEAVLSLPVNGVSNFLKTTSGGIIYHLSKRLPPDPKQFAADREKFAQMLRREAQETMWQEWLKEAYRREQVKFQPRAPRPTAPETEEPEESAPPAPTKG